MAIPINSAFSPWVDQQCDRKHLGREKTEWQLEVLASLLVCLGGVKLHIPTDIKQIKPRARPCVCPRTTTKTWKTKCAAADPPPPPPSPSQPRERIPGKNNDAPLSIPPYPGPPRHIQEPAHLHAHPLPAFRDKGEYGKALEWYQRPLGGQEKALGKDHLNTLRAVQGMATAFRVR